MAAGRYSFVIEQGATLDFEVQYKDSNNDPIDLSGYTGRLQIRSTYAGDGGTLYLTLSSSRNPDGTGLNFSGSNGSTPPSSGSIGIYVPHVLVLNYHLMKLDMTWNFIPDRLIVHLR